MKPEGNKIKIKQKGRVIGLQSESHIPGRKAGRQEVKFSPSKAPEHRGPKLLRKGWPVMPRAGQTEAGSLQVFLEKMFCSCCLAGKVKGHSEVILFGLRWGIVH